MLKQTFTYTSILNNKPQTVEAVNISSALDKIVGQIMNERNVSRTEACRLFDSYGYEIKQS